MNAFDIIDQFFRSLNTEQALLLGILALIVFVFGLLVGWIVQGMKTRRYRKQLLLLRKERDDYQLSATSLGEKNKTLAAELERISREKVEVFDQLQGLRQEVEQRDQLLRETQGQLEEATATNTTYAATINELNEELTDLRTRNQSPAVTAGEDAGAKILDLEPAPATNDGQFDRYLEAIEARFQAFEQRLAELDRENDRLRSGGIVARSVEMPDQSPEDGGFGGDYVPSIGEPAPSGNEPLVIRADTTNPGERVGQHGTTEVIVETTPSLMVPVMQEYRGDPDDLTRIAGIASFLEKQLNEAGIYQYEQIAAWGEGDIDVYAERIGFLPQSMRHKDWVGQAAQLARAKSNTHSSRQKSPAKRNVMVMVEGIGPKIEIVLTAAGISSLADLADSSVDRLREILEAAGPNFKSKDPSTWPEQATLARDGKWEELQNLQKELVGGRRI